MNMLCVSSVVEPGPIDEALTQVKKRSLRRASGVHAEGGGQCV